jgi:hypothetical protein
LGRVWLVAAIPILIFCALFVAQISSRRQLDAVPNIQHAAAPAEAGTPADAPDPDTSDVSDLADDSRGSVDLYGNDVIDAVAQYTFDGTGALYELHSPQTEVPRLRSPKS